MKWGRASSFQMFICPKHRDDFGIGWHPGLARAVKRPNLTPTVLPKYLSDETKIYILIHRIPRVVYSIFLGFFKIL